MGVHVRGLACVLFSLPTGILGARGYLALASLLFGPEAVLLGAGSLFPLAGFFLGLEASFFDARSLFLLARLNLGALASTLLFADSFLGGPQCGLFSIAGPGGRENLRAALKLGIRDAGRTLGRFFLGDNCRRSLTNRGRSGPTHTRRASRGRRCHGPLARPGLHYDDLGPSRLGALLQVAGSGA
jgi:hypothetical protein